MSASGARSEAGSGVTPGAASRAGSHSASSAASRTGAGGTLGVESRAGSHAAPGPNETGAAAGTGSLLACRQLGRRLRALREAAGKTLLDVEVSGIGSQSKIYRIESGHTPVRTGDVRDRCVLYGPPEESREGLLALARASKAGGWQEDYADVPFSRT